MAIKGILFDKDGTLIDFYEVWGTAANAVVDRLMDMYGLFGNREVKTRLFDALGMHGQSIDPEGALAWKPYGLIAEDLVEALRQEEIPASREAMEMWLTDEFFHEVCECRRDYPVFTDVKRLAQELQNRGIHIGLATTDDYRSARICMEKLGVAEEISFYATAGCGYPEKPDGELILMAAKKWCISPGEIAVVGDTPNDMRFAQNGHAVGIGVLSGTGKIEDLEPLADHIIDSVDDLLALLEEL